MKLFILSTIYQYISGENDSNSNTEWSQRHNLYQTVITKVSNNKPVVKSKQSPPQRYLCVGCQLNSDQVLWLLCLKGHVRARCSTLLRHRCKEANEFLCTKTPLLEGVEQPKTSPKNPRNALSDALLMSRFQIFLSDVAKKRGFLKLCFARSWFMN